MTRGHFNIKIRFPNFKSSKNQSFGIMILEYDS